MFPTTETLELGCANIQVALGVGVKRTDGEWLHATLDYNNILAKLGQSHKPVEKKKENGSCVSCSVISYYH